MAEAARLAPGRIPRDHDRRATRLGERRHKHRGNLVLRRRVGMFWGEAVFDLKNAASRLGCKPARDVAVALDSAHDPAAAVDENERGTLPVGAVLAYRDRA